MVKDVPDYALVLGVPGRQAGWMSRHGHLLHFNQEGLAKCPESGLKYKIDGERVHCIDLDEDLALPSDMRQGLKTYDELKGRGS